MNDGPSETALEAAVAVGCRYEASHPLCSDRKAMRAALIAAESAEWQPIATAPRDGTLILVYAPGAHYELPDIMCPCAWDKEFGFCVDELRQPTHWRRWPLPPLDRILVSTPNETEARSERERLADDPVLEPCPRCFGKLTSGPFSRHAPMSSRPKLEQMTEGGLWRVICYGCFMRTISDTRDEAVQIWNWRP